MSLTSYRAAPPRVKTKWRIESSEWNSVSPLAIRHLQHSKRGNSYVLRRPGDDLLSQVLRHSTIGAVAFDGRVRDGIGSNHYAESHQAGEARKKKQTGIWSIAPCVEHGHRLMRAIKPIELLVPVSCTHCCASTPGLSTWSSSTALKGELVLRWVSRLDAFSGYPVHT
jgi:hypothetical protein